MGSYRTLLLCAAIYSSGVSSALAADVSMPSKTQLPLLASSPWQVEVGSRYWLSSGNHKYDLYDDFLTGPTQLISRLTYGNTTGQSSEAFWRVEHESGVFLKGNLGGGTLSSGKMNDEDFMPFTMPYTNTLQVQSGGSLKYLTVDLGWNYKDVAYTGLPYKVGGFVGYNNFHERFNTFGCSQVAAGSICAQSAPISEDGLDLDAAWNVLRVGLSGEMYILQNLRAGLDAAWTYNWLQATDYHNSRPLFRGLDQVGTGGGAQLEGLLSYDITSKFSIGVGARYWLFNAAGKALMEKTMEGLSKGGLSQVINTRSERYGAFLQAAYRFGGANDSTQSGVLGPNFAKSEQAPNNWAGAYLGVNTGYGFGSSGVSTLSSASPVAALLQGYGYVPYYQRSDVAGFVGGGQVGYNINVMKSVVAGLEADIDYANIGGSFGKTSFPYVIATTTKTQLQWLGTLRGRIGFLPRDDFMIYATGGLAYGGVYAQSTVNEPTESAGSAGFIPMSFGQYANTATGWTAGAGAELAVAKNWSLKAEWLYVALGNQSYAVTPIVDAAPAAFNASANNNNNIIRTGVNYRFDLTTDNTAPIAAKF